MAASGGLVNCLLGGSVLNYVGHRACICKSSPSVGLSKKIVKLSELFKRQEQAGGQRIPASIGQRVIGHGLALYLIALLARSCLGRNSEIIFASDMG